MHEMRECFPLEREPSNLIVMFPALKSEGNSAARLVFELLLMTKFITISLLYIFTTDFSRLGIIYKYSCFFNDTQGGIPLRGSSPRWMKEPSNK